MPGPSDDFVRPGEIGFLDELHDVSLNTLRAKALVKH